jgi:hypothetical protein
MKKHRYLVAWVFAALFVSTAASAADPDYTFVPVDPVIIVPENQIGVLHFTLTNLRDIPLTIGGYVGDALFLDGDPSDGFAHEVLGKATPFVLAAFGVEDIPVEIIPDLADFGETDNDYGAWLLGIFPNARVGAKPGGGIAGLPFAKGRIDTSLVIITDVPVPEPSSWFMAASGLAGVGALSAFKKRRRRL